LLSRITRRAHLAAERYLPEQRLYLRTETTTRYLRLTPGTQAVLLVVGGFIALWTVLSTSVVLTSMLSPDSTAAQLRIQQAEYIERLNAISHERDQRALEAQKAQERFYVALDQISKQQTTLLASEDRRRELETGIEVIQRTLRKTMKERDRATDQAESLLTELQSVTGETSTASGAAAETEETLDYLITALDKTVSERDTAVYNRTMMEAKVANLEHEAKLTAERNERIFERLEEAVTVSISPLEKLFENVGLSTDKLLEDVKAGYSGMGGPLTPIAVSTKGEDADPTSLQANVLLSEMDKVNLLRIAAERTPFAMPVRTSYRLTSGYGWRKHPTSGKTRLHEGTDFAGAVGTPIYSTADGVVTFAGWAGGYGRVIKIRHALGFETRYAHLSKISVKQGQRVSRGDRIGDMGSSGRSTGPHVHYEVRIGGKAVNPMTYIKAARNVF
jgi:murein DD-endopeptidase MepM/ murein hydrolase activator NlpD